MSISTPHTGGNRRPTSAVSTGSPATKQSGEKATGATATADTAKTTSATKGAATTTKAPKAGAARQTKSAAGKSSAATASAKQRGRRPVTPVKVKQGRDWGPIALFVAVGAIALLIIGYGGYYVYQGSRTWEDRANAIEGIINYRKTRPDLMQNGQHQQGPISYEIKPPAMGPHNPTWQRCMGDVYEEPIASEHAVHSLEHGAVWITYRPDLPKDQVDKLAAKVRGNDFMLMSPFDGLDRPISLQAWGYQLKVDNADDGRIDEFIRALRQNATVEPGASCSTGDYVTATGTTPRNITTGQMPGNG